MTYLQKCRNWRKHQSTSRKSIHVCVCMHIYAPNGKTYHTRRIKMQFPYVWQVINSTSARSWIILVVANLSLSSKVPQENLHGATDYGWDKGGCVFFNIDQSLVCSLPSRCLIVQSLLATVPWFYDLPQNQYVLAFNCPFYRNECMFYGLSTLLFVYLFSPTTFNP